MVSVLQLLISIIKPLPVDVMNETWGRTALTLLKHGSEVNLERALSVNVDLGSHRYRTH